MPKCQTREEKRLPLPNRCVNQKQQTAFLWVNIPQECFEQLHRNLTTYFLKGGPANNVEGQYGGPCSNGNTFFTPYEAGFVLNFTIVDGLPRGCGELDGPWRFKQPRPNCKRVFSHWPPNIKECHEDW